MKCDFYCITQLAAFFAERKHEDQVTFEGFVRKLPEQRNFLVFAGLGTLLEELQSFKFTGPQIAYLKYHPALQNMGEDFWNYLYNLRFKATVKAPREGTLLFADEPFIQIHGSLGEIVVMESLILSHLNTAMAVASKAARIRIAAGPKATLAEFGYRRGANPLIASRSAYVGGFDSTSNVEAGYEYGIPVSGTMAHLYIMAHKTEKEAFQAYNDVFGAGTALIDTYDALEGLKSAISAFKTELWGVRLDSGDKIVLSRNMRVILDEAGQKNTKIIVSDDLNEYSLNFIRMMEAPIDGFGVGTAVVNPGALGGVFKLVEYQGVPKAKFSENKSTYPGAKQIYRHYKDGVMLKDVLALDNEEQTGEPLLETVMINGVYEVEPLNVVRKRAQEGVASLPSQFLSLDNVFTYNVELSDDLENLTEEMENEYGKKR